MLASTTTRALCGKLRQGGGIAHCHNSTLRRGLRAHARPRMHPQPHTHCADLRRMYLCGLLARVRMRTPARGGCGSFFITVIYL